MNIMKVQTTNKETLLDAIISVPWGDNFEFGIGVDAVSGSLMPTVFKSKAQPTLQNTMSSHEKWYLIQNESDLTREISLSLSGQYNVEGLDIGGSAKYVGELQCSELVVSFVASYVSEYKGYDTIDTPELSDQAKTVDPAHFREQYGDYFVRGGVRGSSFNAVYTCKSTKVSDLDSFKANVSANLADVDVFSIEGKGKFLDFAKNNKIEITVEVFMDGFPDSERKNAPDPRTPDQVLDALKWFKEHEVGTYVRAELMHYSAVNPSIPRVVPVSPDTFEALRALYETTWEIRALYNACPPKIQPKYTDRHDQLLRDVSSHKVDLPAHNSLIAEYQSEADGLQRDLRDVFDRMSFYAAVADAVALEPPKGLEVDAADGRTSFFYGYKAYVGNTGRPIPIKADPQTFYKNYEGPGWQQTTLNWQDPTRIVVGWEVVSNWPTWLNGQWKKMSDQIILKSAAPVYVSSCYDRGTNWTVNVFSVPEEDYRF